MPLWLAIPLGTFLALLAFPAAFLAAYTLAILTDWVERQLKPPPKPGPAPGRRPFPPKITLTRLAGGWEARAEGDPELWTSGPDRDQTLGRLVTRLAERNLIEVTLAAEG